MISKAEATITRHFVHVSLKDSRGNPVACRASGKCKTWVTRPDEFKLPCKYGMYTSFYITHDNAHEWRVA